MDPALHQLQMAPATGDPRQGPATAGRAGPGRGRVSLTLNGDGRGRPLLPLDLPHHLLPVHPGPRAGLDIGTIQVRGVDDIVFFPALYLPPGRDELGAGSRGSASTRTRRLGGRRHLSTASSAAHDGGFRATRRLLPGSEWLLQHFQRVVVESMSDPSEPPRSPTGSHALLLTAARG